MVEGKKLILTVSGWLKVFSDGSVDRSWSGSDDIKKMTDPVRPHEDEFINGVKVKDVSVGDASLLRFRIYLPKNSAGEAQGKLPILLHFHGGGFCISQPDWHMYYCFYRRLAALANAVCVSVYLRLAPEHRLPAACDDGFSALLWLKSVSSGESQEAWLTSKGDFTRIFLIGDSTGGNIAHHVAARAGEIDLYPARVAGAILNHPGFCRSERSNSERKDMETPFLTLDMMDQFLKLSLPEGCDKDHPITCPMGQKAPPLENFKLVPILLCMAEKDMLWDTEMEYYEAMKKAGQEVDLFVSKDMSHSFYLNSLAGETDETRDLHQKIADFIFNYM